MKETLHILIRVSTQTENKGGTSLITQKQKGIELSENLGMNYEIHNEGGTSSSNDTLDSRCDIETLSSRMFRFSLRY